MSSGISRHVNLEFPAYASVDRMDGWRDRAIRRYNTLKREQGLTQVALAAEVGVGQSAISMWLSGERSPETLDLYEALARGLNMHPAEMLYGFDMLSVELYQRIARLDPERQAAILTVINSMTPERNQDAG